MARTVKVEAAGGFEPPNNGFANRRLRPLGYAAGDDFELYPLKKVFF